MWRALCGPVAALALITHGALPQQTADVVTMVVDKAGHSVRGLALADFSVLIDNRPVDVARISAGPGPVGVALAVDRSSSMRISLSSAARSAPMWSRLLSGEVRGVLHPGDELRASTFGRDVTVSAPLTLSADALKKAGQVIDRDQSALSPSPIWDAVVAAAQALSPSVTRRLVILMSDGRATGSRLSVDEAATGAAGAGVAVSVIDDSAPQRVSQERGLVAAVRPDRALAWIADVTGGAYLGGPKGGTADGRLVIEAITALRDAYVLTVPAPADGKPHALLVRCTRAGATVRAPKALMPR